MAIVRQNGTAEFGKAFAAHPTLDASVLGGPCVGVQAIAAFFAATSSCMYETIEFTHAHHRWQENLSRMARKSLWETGPRNHDSDTQP